MQTVSLITAPGRGAIASLLVLGERAWENVTHFFRPASGRPSDPLQPDRPVLGRWVSAEVSEELIVVPRGLREVEVHCHGGDAAWRRIAADLQSRGHRLVDWPAALAALGMPPLDVQWRQAISRAATERTAAVLMAQGDGRWPAMLDGVQRAIRGAATEPARRQIEQVLAWSEFGRHLVQPWVVVFAGRANVGKSSLVNALLGFARSIVFDQPGTTRDVLSATTAIDGWPVELKDTAGLRAAADDPEATGQRIACGELSRADLVVQVIDASLPANCLEPDLLGLDTADRRIVVANKSDLPAARPLPSEAICTSALTGQGMAQLIAAIAGSLVPQIPGEWEVIPFCEEQIDLLQSVRSTLASGDRPAAIGQLQLLSGANSVS